jgi:hypothetical protein
MTPVTRMTLAGSESAVLDIRHEKVHGRGMIFAIKR